MRARRRVGSLALAGGCAAVGCGAVPVCHPDGAHLVIERPGPPPAFVLRAATPGGSDCDTTPRAGDRSVPRGPHEFFVALAGDRLVLDRGTGPDGRQLVARAIAGGVPDFTWPYSEVVRVHGTQLIAWRSDPAPPTPERCPELAAWRAHGLGAALERQWRIDAATGRSQALDAWRCAPRQ